MGTVLTFTLFIIAAIVDSTIRSQYGGPMVVDGLPIDNARVTGKWTPDFLWVSKAWTIEVQSDVKLELHLDGETYIIPKGSHEIYSNHDHTNTGQFGAHDFWGYPEKVEIRHLDGKP